MLDLLFKLLIAHALTDFALQSEAMAKGKNRHKKPDYISKGQKYIPCWPYWLAAHALINSGGVYIVTGSLFCSLLEVTLHWLFDFIKCDNRTNPNQDQLLHFISKILYVFIL